MSRLSSFVLASLLVAGFLFSCTTPNTKTVVEQATENTDLSTLVTAIQAAGLAETLSGEGPFTVFAPTNAAFEALPEGLLATLLKPESKDLLTSILTYHVISGKIKAEELTNGQTAATVQGENVTFDLSSGAKINDATITTTNIEVANGVIHLIDKVILPPSVVAAMQKKNIVELASATEALSTLVAAVTAAGLVETLSGEGPFTVFAPTNEAFAALPAGTVENLLKPENKDQLISILTYHVVAGKIMSSDLQNGQKVATVQGGEITVDLSAGAKINDATVVTADVDASNGVVHVIDKVILPPAAAPKKKK